MNLGKKRTNKLLTSLEKEVLDASKDSGKSIDKQYVSFNEFNRKYSQAVILSKVEVTTGGISPNRIRIAPRTPSKTKLQKIVADDKFNAYYTDCKKSPEENSYKKDGFLSTARKLKMLAIQQQRKELGRSLKKNLQQLVESQKHRPIEKMADLKKQID